MIFTIHFLNEDHTITSLMGDVKSIGWMANMLERTHTSFKVMSPGSYHDPSYFGWGGFTYWLPESTSWNDAIEFKLNRKPIRFAKD